MIDLRFDEEELAAARATIVGFIRDMVEDAGAEGAVLGLSGGIDSTLTAYLAVEALGADGLRGLVLPGAVTDEANVADAEDIARDLGIEHDVVPIDPIVAAVAESLPGGTAADWAIGNARARIRGVLNYFVANQDDRIVLGTGNRSEAAVGYFTKYGDGAVDCHPIGGLYKAQVRQLAAHVGVPERLVEKTPTAELWSDQTDEEELGVDYDTLDAVLALHVDGPLSAATTCRLVGCEPEVAYRIVGMHERSRHKRRMPPSPPLPWA